MSESLRNRVQRNQKLTYELDKLCNRILKTTMCCLVRDRGVTGEHKAALNRTLVFFDGVALLELPSIEWSRLPYRRNARHYEILLNI